MLLERAGPLSCRNVKHYVENVVAAQQDASIVRDQLVVLGLGGPFQQNVHVAIALDHLALVLAAVIQHDCDSCVQLLDEDV